MEQHIGRPLPLEELAHKLDLSARQLERLFKAETGKSPQTFAKQVRLRTAAWLLTSSDRGVADIAFSCGFADASHLGREFRKQFGMPPAAYRDKATNSDDPASHDNDVAVRSGAESDLISVDQHVVPSPSSSASSLLLAANGVPEMR